MSEPLSAHEIEDVLSSIRRLVSEELRPAVPAAAEPAKAPGAEPAFEVGKLLLTPSLRVVTPAEPEATPVAGLAPGEEVVAVGMAEDDDLWAAPGTLEDSAEDDPDAPAPAPDLPRGHWTAETVPQVDWMQADADWVEEEPVPFVAHPRKPAITDEPLARAWAERAEAEVRAELQAPRPAPKPEAAAPKAEAKPAAGLFDQDDPLLDEEALRDIVREIIREELAGTLGERITRNVRKLVRVEINRALTAREFE